MRHYAMREVTILQEEMVLLLCDGCGIPEQEAEFGSLIHVEIGVNVGEEFGMLDEYDYCDPCLVDRAPLLLAAGSRSELVGGTPPDTKETSTDG